MCSATTASVASITGRDRSESTWFSLPVDEPPAGSGHVPLVLRYPFYLMCSERVRPGRVADLDTVGSSLRRTGRKGIYLTHARHGRGTVGERGRRPAAGDTGGGAVRRRSRAAARGGRPQPDADRPEPAPPGQAAALDARPGSDRARHRVPGGRPGGRAGRGGA